MSESLPLTGPVDLEALDQFLMSDASPEGCMQLSDLDGFLTGIAIGPELVMPSEWLPAIWGGEEIAGDWAKGFVDAIRLRPEAWRPLLEDREALVLLVPTLALCGDAEGEGGSPLELDREADADLLAEAPELIPACVAGIDGFWKERRGRPEAGPGRAKSAKVGRNDPCPCGSGRKHKRCCGAH